MRTADLILALFTFYFRPVAEGFPISGLIRALDLLGISEDGARCAVSRLKREGWLAQDGQGTRGVYRLSQEGERRAAGLVPSENLVPPANWDRTWHIVSYWLPETKRPWRDDLRDHLQALGYGRLNPGTYLAPSGREGAVRARLAELGLEKAVHSFRARYDGAEEGQLVGLLWDLSAIDQRYRSFLAKYQPIYQQFRELPQAPGHVSFVGHLYLNLDYAEVLALDPRLPAELLPDDWPAAEAARLFAEYQDYLHGPAREFVTELLATG
ncbi:MAG: PaaX family transcriptional regulator C-terminal domain-containing protein [Bacillota bacterium]